MCKKEPKIKIMMSYHKPSALFKDDMFIPIHAGRVIAKESSRNGTINNEDLLEKIGH